MLKEFIESININPDNVHLIGHSLGSHIATAIGKVFNGSIGRITALDPARPLFHDNDRDIISKNDAKFLDVIHSCSKILGIFEPKGHVDFYPNYGTASQPGCEILDIMYGCMKIINQIYQYYKLCINKFKLKLLLNNNFSCMQSLSGTALFC